MSNLPIPIDSNSEIQLLQTEEIIRQLKRIADALEVGNKMYRTREYMPEEQWVCRECHSKEDITKFVHVTDRTKEPVYLCSKCFYAGVPMELREWRDEEEASS